MNKYIFSLFFLLLSNIGTAWGWSDFSAMSPSGHTLYYTILDGSNSVEVSAFYTIESPYDVHPVGDVIIPDSVVFGSITGNITYAVTRITAGAFKNSSELTSIEIPNTIVAIGGQAFYNCTGLTSIEIPNTVVSIGEYAFYNCTGLTQVTIPREIRLMGGYAFSGCTGLIEVNYLADSCNSDTYSSGAFFAFDTNLTILNIGKDVRYLSNTLLGSFIESHLTTINVDRRNTVFDSRDGCNAIIQTATNTLLFGCRTTVIPNTVIIIGNFAFHNCRRLSEIHIPTSIVEIGQSAFEGTGLQQIEIPSSVSVIGPVAFGRTRLSHVVIPNTVTSLGDGAFWQNPYLQSVIIGDSVPTIASVTFWNCPNLTSIQIGRSVSSIEIEAFENCYSLQSVFLPLSIDTIHPNAFLNCSTLVDIYCESPVACGIGGNPFTGVSDSVTVHIPCGSTPSYVSRWGHCITYFVEQPRFTLDVSSMDTSMGSAYVVIPPSCVDTVSMFMASANLGCIFHHWNDGNTDNPRTIVLSSDTTIKAYFAYLVHDTTILIQDIHDTAWIHDTTIVSQWVYDTIVMRDTIYQDNYIHDTIRIEKYIYDTILLQCDKPRYALNVIPASDAGIAVGSGVFYDSTVVEIVAIPINGNRFTRWSDGNTDNPRHVMMIEDITLVALFDAEDVVDEYGEPIILVRGHTILIIGAEGENVRIFDVLGRLYVLGKDIANEQPFEMVASGCYLVQVGERAAQKIVVID